MWISGTWIYRRRRLSEEDGVRLADVVARSRDSRPVSIRRSCWKRQEPGLGIRGLHKEGINGEGVGIAILDQPLLLGHEEYTSCLIHYDATKASGMSPRFHGSPIAGIAAGRTCGVAPNAFVFYYASPTSVEHQMQADYIKEIIRHNENKADPGRIRVISISHPLEAPATMCSCWPGRRPWTPASW